MTLIRSRSQPQHKGMALRFQQQIEQLPLFQNRTPTEIQALLAGAGERVLKHRERLFNAGESASHFFIVVQGAFKLVRTGSDGEDIIVHFATPGELIGALLMAPAGAVYPVTAVSMGHSIVAAVTRETYMKSWNGNPTVQTAVGQILFSRMNQMHAQKTMSKRPLAQKVASLLVSLIERYSGENETILPIPLTRQEIADSLGASVESVIRVMSDWSHKKYISTSDQLIHIQRMDKILEIIKGGQE